MKLPTKCLFLALLCLSKAVYSIPYHPERWQTQKGVPVIFYQAKEVPMLDISLAFRAGSAYDGERYGLSALTSHMLNQGSLGKGATALAQGLADLGSQYSAENGYDMVVYNLRTLITKEALAPSLAIFSDMVNHPDFPPNAFAREKNQQLMSIKQSKESPEDLAMKQFFKTLYQNHPYAHPVDGTTESVTNLQREELLRFYKDFYVAQNAILVIVGAIDSQQAHKLAEDLTKPMIAGRPAPAIAKAQPLAASQTISIPFPASQTVLRLGQLGIDHNNPHYFALMVGNYLLGGGSLVSKLAVELREKHGLTYNVDSQFIPMPGEGPFVIGLSTRKKQTQQALTLTKEVLNNFIQKGPSEDDLTAAKQYLTGSFPLSLAGNRSIASVLLRMAFYHLPDDYLSTYISKIEAVTAKEVQAAFQEIIHPNNLLLIEVGS